MVWLTDHLAMTIAVNWDVKPQTKQKNILDSNQFYFILQQCLLFHEKIDEFIKHLKDKDRPGSGSRSTAVVSKKVPSDHTSQHTMNLVRQLVNWLVTIS